MALRYAIWLFPPKVARVVYPLFFGLSLLPQLSRLRRFDAACLIGSWGFPDAVAVAAFSRILRVPLIIKTYGSDVNLHARYRFRAAQMRWAMNLADAVICVSEALKQRLVEIGVSESKIRVIPTGVDDELFSPMTKHEACGRIGCDVDRHFVLYVGNLLKTKGIHELFEAFASLAKERADVDLVVIGDGPETPWLSRQIRAAGLEGRVQLKGRIAHDALNPWFNAADLLCLPSYGEGLPNVVLEAMTCGIPVVATRVGGIPEIVTEETGELVAPCSSDALAGGIRRCLAQEWDREVIREKAQRFTWDANIAMMAGAIEQAIGGRSRRS
jgi:glycosyltransferase involved in cell wall biosynthesis